VPTSAEALAECLALLAARATPTIVCGGGSRLGLGNAARGARVLLSTGGLSEVLEFDEADGVVQVSGGTRLSDLAALAGAAGWEVPLDPPGLRTTIGGALASAVEGPQSSGRAFTRDCVLGLGVAMANGVRTRCGGRVVKNVTGYDLAKLYVGSFGSLGVIESAWLRLRPVPREVVVRRLAIDDAAAGAWLARAAALRPSARAVTLLDAALLPDTPDTKDEPSFELVCEFAGDPVACAADVDWLAAAGAARSGSPEDIDAIRSLQGSAPTDGVRVRFQVLPTQVVDACDALRAASAQLLVHAASSTIHAFFRPPSAGRDDAWFDGVLDTVNGLERSTGAVRVIEEMPEWARAGCDVFGSTGDALPLMRGLKQRFDPSGILNPGRFAGGL